MDFASTGRHNSQSVRTLLDPEHVRVLHEAVAARLGVRQRRFGDLLQPGLEESRVFAERQELPPHGVGVAAPHATETARGHGTDARQSIHLLIAHWFAQELLVFVVRRSHALHIVFGWRTFRHRAFCDVSKDYSGC